MPAPCAISARAPLVGLALLLASAACGARTGLEVQPGPPLDAGGGADAVVAGACTSGVVTLVSGQYATSHRVPGAIALDATRIYWIDAGDAVTGMGSVRSVSKCGGPVQTLASGLYYPTSLGVNAATVFWADAGDSGHSVLGGIFAVPAAAGAVATLVSEYDSMRVAVDAQSVYWTNPAMASVERVPQAGGAATTIASETHGPESIALDDTHVYWTAAGSVLRAPKAGGAPVTLASGTTLAYGLAVDGTYAYYQAGDGSGYGTLTRVAIDGSGGPPLALAPTAVTGLAVDATSVYWTDNGGGRRGAGNVLRIARTGGNPVTIATAQSSAVAGIAVDDTSVYWVNDREIMKAPK